MNKSLVGSGRKVVAESRRVACLSIVVSTLLCSLIYGQPQLLRDINTEFDMSFTPYSSLTSTPTQVFYLNGSTLWVTKGSMASTLPLKRFEVIHAFTVVGSSIYFAADDGAGSGTEIWKSNGTISGTVRIKDVFPGSRSSEPTYITAVNLTTILFSAKNGKNGRELWKTNGTGVGTVMVKDIHAATASSSPALITKVGSFVFFVANDGQHGVELWKSDGTSPGTAMVKDIYAELKMSSRPQLLTEVNGSLFFRADNGLSGFELYKSDGTEAGTFMLKDIRPGLAAGDVQNLIKVNGRLLFTANDGIHGDELWRSNGTPSGTMLVKDLNPGGGGSNNTDSWGLIQPMNNFTNVDGILFFTGGNGGAESFIVRSDGTAAGTYRVTNLEPVGLNDLQPCFSYLNGFVYFFNQLDRNDYHLFRMGLDGQNITPLREYTTPLDFYANFHQYMVASGDALYVSALHSDGWSLQKQYPDGNTLTLSSGKGPTAGSDPEQFVKANNLIYFPVTIGFVEPEYELWRTDGTRAGTITVAALDLSNYELLPVGDKLFFSRRDELFVTLGTPETTIKLIGFSNPGFVVHGLTAVNDVVYFHNYTGDIWKSDGTPAGTMKVGTLQNIISITNVGGKAFVLNQTWAGGLEVWRTSVGGLVRVKVIRTDAGVASEYGPTASVENIFYFVGNDGLHGNEVWRSDGTTLGTTMVTDLNTIDSVNSIGNEEDIRSFTVFNNELYLSATDSNNKWHLLMVTGKNSVARISPLLPVFHSIGHNGKLYLFTMPLDRHNYSEPPKLWVSDGKTTGATTFISWLPFGPIDDALVNGDLYYTTPGAQLMQITDCGVKAIDLGNSSAYPIEGLGDDLVFGGNLQGDREPFIYYNIAAIANTCISAARIESEAVGAGLSGPWPNPYTLDFSLRIPGIEGEKVDVVIFDTAGFPVETFIGLSTNTDYPHMGSTLSKGIYLIKINQAEKVMTQRVVRK
jgi:ELWxxDGT repeat protein